jgi:hypothetical protein
MGVKILTRQPVCLRSQLIDLIDARIFEKLIYAMQSIFYEKTQPEGPTGC